MIFAVSEMYFEAVRQDTTPEHMSNYNCQSLFYHLEVYDDWTVGNCMHEVGVSVSSIHFAARRTFPLHKQPVSQN
jgi:hypothetical protein